MLGTERDAAPSLSELQKRTKPTGYSSAPAASLGLLTMRRVRAFYSRAEVDILQCVWKLCEPSYRPTSAQKATANERSASAMTRG